MAGIGYWDEHQVSLNRTNKICMQHTEANISLIHINNPATLI